MYLCFCFVLTPAPLFPGHSSWNFADRRTLRNFTQANKRFQRACPECYALPLAFFSIYSAHFFLAKPPALEDHTQQVKSQSHTLTHRHRNTEWMVGLSYGGCRKRKRKRYRGLLCALCEVTLRPTHSDTQLWLSKNYQNTRTRSSRPVLYGDDDDDDVDGHTIEERTHAHTQNANTHPMQ